MYWGAEILFCIRSTDSRLNLNNVIRPGSSIFYLLSTIFKLYPASISCLFFLTLSVWNITIWIKANLLCSLTEVEVWNLKIRLCYERTYAVKMHYEEFVKEKLASAKDNRVTFNWFPAKPVCPVTIFSGKFSSCHIIKTSSNTKSNSCRITWHKSTQPQLSCQGHTV